MRDLFLNCERHVNILNKHKCNAVKEKKRQFAKKMKTLNYSLYKSNVGFNSFTFELRHMLPLVTHTISVEGILYLPAF